MIQNVDLYHKKHLCTMEYIQGANQFLHGMTIQLEQLNFFFKWRKVY